MGGPGFADAVSSLLGAYTRCIHLLSSLSGSGRKGDSDDLSKLQSTIHSDRSKVRRAYASSLRADGAPFERGDGASLPQNQAPILEGLA
jgi:hypothetical protein